MKPRMSGTVVTSLLVVAVCAALTGVAASGVEYAAYSSDDDIPGVKMPASPFSDSITETTTVGLEDLDDVFSVPVRNNQLLDIRMTLDDAEPTDDFDLIMFPPGTKAPISTAYDNLKMVAASENPAPGGAERIRYVPDRSQVGTHYAQVYGFYADGDDEKGGKGDYTITWSVKNLTAQTVSSRSSRTIVKYGSTSTVSGRSLADGAAAANVPYRIMGRAVGTSTWKVVKTGTTAADGTFSTTVKPLRTTEYYVRMQWYSTAQGEDFGYGYSPLMKVAPRAYLSFRTAPRVAYRNRAFTVSGIIKPGHSTSRRHVKIVAERWNGKRWVRVKSTYVRSSGTKFSGRITLPYRGTYRLQAKVGADRLHAAKNSARRKLTVR